MFLLIDFKKYVYIYINLGDLFLSLVQCACMCASMQIVIDEDSVLQKYSCRHSGDCTSPFVGGGVGRGCRGKQSSYT